MKTIEESRINGVLMLPVGRNLPNGGKSWVPSWKRLSGIVQFGLTNRIIRKQPKQCAYQETAHLLMGKSELIKKANKEAYEASEEGQARINASDFCREFKPNDKLSPKQQFNVICRALNKHMKNSNYKAYVVYHEDESNTWAHGWSSDDYKHDDEDVLVCETTWLIGKKKPTSSFRKAQTYTAECALFIFIGLKEIASSL